MGFERPFFETRNGRPKPTPFACGRPEHGKNGGESWTFLTVLIAPSGRVRAFCAVSLTPCRRAADHTIAAHDSAHPVRQVTEIGSARLWLGRAGAIHNGSLGRLGGFAKLFFEHLDGAADPQQRALLLLSLNGPLQRRR